MLGHMCSKCKTKYTVDEYIFRLAENKGCIVCGKRFFHDRFQIQDTIDTKLGKLRISTVCLEMEHPGGYYESMVFGMDEEPIWRYEKDEEAIVGHAVIVDILKKATVLDYDYIREEIDKAFDKEMGERRLRFGNLTDTVSLYDIQRELNFGSE